MSERSGVVRTSEERLLEEVRELRAELRGLQLRVDRQEDDLASLSASFSAVSIGGDRSSVGSREFTEAPSSPARPASAASVGGGGGPALEQNREGLPVSWTVREAVARDIGLWLRRSLNGEHRGNSGRERVALSSRYYLVVRTFRGEVHRDPVLVYNRFTPVKQICQEGGSWAGLSWPDRIL